MEPRRPPTPSLVKRLQRLSSLRLNFVIDQPRRRATARFVGSSSLVCGSRSVPSASLGSTESLVCPVKLYLGSDLTPEEHARAQITDSTVRLAVGIEHVDDLIADLEQALRKIFG